MRLTSCLEKLKSCGGAITGADICTLKASDAESIASNVSTNSTVTMQYRPCMSETLVSCGGSKLDKSIEVLNNTLVLDSIRIGDTIRGHVINDVDVGKTGHLLTQMLRSGLTYVFSGSTLVGSLAMYRAYVDLRKELPKQLLKRRADVRRVLRKHSRESNMQLSFRINSAFDTVVSCLREHHGLECWVNDAVERCWKVMYDAGKLWTLELWHGDELIAADIAHPIEEDGCIYSVYIATRVAKRTYGKLQPGFILALASLDFLRKLKVSFWDLGGVDLNPLMGYKYDLTTVMTRPYFVTDFFSVKYPLVAGSSGNGGVRDSEHIFINYTVIDSINAETFA